MKENCLQCKYTRKVPLEFDLLYCFRYPPIFAEGFAYGQFPIVTANSWCGEFQPKKINLGFNSEKMNEDIESKSK